MPLYEYKCKRCGTVNEFLSKRGDTGDELFCKACGDSGLEKVMSVATVSKLSSRGGGEACSGPSEQCESLPCRNSCGCV